MEQTDWVGGGVEWSVEMLARSCSCVTFAAGCSDGGRRRDGTGRGGEKKLEGGTVWGEGRQVVTPSPGLQGSPPTGTAAPPSSLD